jgi:ribosomal protein S18 acetylase RimI-like enzyme
MVLWSAATGQGSVFEDDDVIACVTGSSHAFLNKIIPKGGRPSVESFSQAVEFVRDCGVPFTTHLRVGTDDHLVPVANGLGLQATADLTPMPGMVMSDPPESWTAPEGLSIEFAADMPGLVTNLRTCCEGFEMSSDVLDMFATDYMLNTDDLWFLTGFIDDTPVVTSVGMKIGDIDGIYNVATLPQYRGRGFGAVLTRLAVAEGIQRGCSVASLQSSEMGYSLYERLGFEGVLDWNGFTG